MKVYACSIAAVNVMQPGFSRMFAHTVYICYADSDVEAQARAYLLAKERWQEAYGWKEHSVETLEVKSEVS